MLSGFRRSPDGAEAILVKIARLRALAKGHLNSCSRRLRVLAPHRAGVLREAVMGCFKNISRQMVCSDAQRRGVVFSNEVGLSGLPTRASDADNSCEMAESELAK
jgi:hypothetical protein